jgi:hypothetical protein
MGMYDTVFAPCPECGKLLQFQSKAGECLLKEYSHKNVPIGIATDLELENEDGKPYDTEFCCGKEFCLKTLMPKRVPMHIVEVEKTEGKEWD